MLVIEYNLPILFITLGRLVTVAKKFSHRASSIFDLLSSEALVKYVLIAFVQYSATSGYSSLLRQMRASNAKGTDVCIALKKTRGKNYADIHKTAQNHTLFEIYFKQSNLKSTRMTDLFVVRLDYTTKLISVRISFKLR